MFTGIVTHIGTVSAVGNGPVRRIRVDCPENAIPQAVGASISCSGICLTSVALDTADPPKWFEADLSPETLARTVAGEWRVGARINLERPLRVGDELGGHVVTGHVDGTCELLAREQQGESERFTFRAPEQATALVAEKGSVAVDGISLTVAAVHARNFDVSVIPHTREFTTICDLAPGRRANLEVDILARYVKRIREVTDA